MSEEMNVSGQDTAIENSEVSTENSEIQDTVEKGTSAENSETQDNTSNDNEGNETNESDDSQVEQEASEGSDSESATDDEVFVTADDGNQIMRGQAENFAKMGYEYQNIHKPILEKLDRIAANARKENGEGYSSLAEFADSMLKAIDDNLRSECLRDAHGDSSVADELFKLRKSERDKNFTDLQEQKAKARQDKIDDKSRQIADDFLRLQKKFPEIKTYGELPKEVKTYAAKNNVSLLEAKLTLDYDNRIAADKVKADAMIAAKASTGSQSGVANEGVSSEIDALIRGIRS